MDAAFGQLRTPAEPALAVRVHENPSPRSVICRCGVRIPAGGTAVHVERLPLAAEELFRDRRFCSVRCLRAFCLESLETLDGLDTLKAKAVVSDLHTVYRGVAELFAQVLIDT